MADDLNYASIRGAEKILEPGEDWRVPGTGTDPLVRETFGPASPDRSPRIHV